MLPKDPLERARQRMWVEMSSDVIMGQYKTLVSDFDARLREMIAMHDDIAA